MNRRTEALLQALAAIGRAVSEDRAAEILASVDGQDPFRSMAEDLTHRAWEEGRSSFALDLLRPLDENGVRPSTPNPYPPSDPALKPDTKTIPEPIRSQLIRLNMSGPGSKYPHEGDCGGTRCEYCSCCVHSTGTLGCLTSTAPVGMACPQSGCGCEGTGS